MKSFLAFYILKIQRIDPTFAQLLGYTSYLPISWRKAIIDMCQIGVGIYLIAEYQALNHGFNRNPTIKLSKNSQ